MLCTCTAASCPCNTNYADSIIVPPSPLPTRIGTNYAPTAFERLHIQSAIADVEPALAQLDSALEHLKAAQERLLLKRSALQQYATAHAALLSPIHRVPPEILAAIFEYLLPEWDSANQRSRMLPSHVCKRWRELSLSTPYFWSEISVVVDSWHIGHKLERAEAWLARSGSLPLTVQLSFHAPVCRAQWQSALDLLLPHSKRWRHLSIYSTVPTGLVGLKDNLPMLEGLHAEFPSWPEHVLFESAPKLDHVRVGAAELLNGASLPWTQLTVLYVTHSSVQQALDILKKLPNVVSYMLTLSTLLDIDPVAGPYEVPPLRLVNLKHLEVAAKDSISGFHESLELPALTEYAYQKLGKGATGWSMSSLSSLIARSSCTVIAVQIHSDSAVGTDDVALLLQHTPCLRILEIHMGGATSNIVLQALAIRSGATYLVPQLQALFIHYDGGVDLQLLADTILLRCKLKEGTPLKAFRATVENHSIGAHRRIGQGPAEAPSRDPEILHHPIRRLLWSCHRGMGSERHRSFFLRT
ncbi:hypothetical protein HWV62_16400 [Athelia sp. TMB]|nr:hypothetical protein HWV62_16400 [Athelia sp. TMB]